MHSFSLQSDFTAGELSPSLFSRIDLAKYTKGCRTLRNFIVQPYGQAVKRTGFVLLGELPSPAILIEFVFNNNQTYALVMGEKWLRVATHDGFVMDGDVPYQIATPYTLAQAKTLSYVQSADVLFIACQDIPPQKLMRLGHAEWKFEAMNFDAPLDAPEWKNEGGEAYTYTRYVNHNVYVWKTTGTHGGYTLINEPLYVRTNKPFPNCFARFINEAKKSDGSLSIAQCVTPYSYYVTAVDAQGKESGASQKAEVTGPSSNNWQAGDYVLLAWAEVEGAEEYRLYKAEYEGRPGYIATITSTSYQDHNVAPSVSEGIPKYVNPFVLKDAEGKEVEDYPGTVCLFEQRLVFASTPKRPQTIWMSKSGDYTNFATYTPITDDSSVELTIASQEVSPANWIVPLRSLILGTPSMEWEISGQSDSAFSGKNAKVKPQSYWGSTLKRALIVGNVILHVSSSGRQIRNLQYDFGSDSYAGSDLSILASHLFEKHAIIDWAYQKTPDSIIWAVRNDGVLLGLTFQAEHQISAWHRHDTDGKFMAVCSVPHNDEHDLFVVVMRDGKYFLERKAPRYLGGDPSRAVFLDCALTYEGDAVHVLSGLDHLEGKQVGVFSQGAVEPSKTVKKGKITLEAPSNLVTVGLLYTADLETMPIEVATQNGSSIGCKKQVSTVNITFQDSLGAKIGLSKEPGNLSSVTWQDLKMRTNEAYGTPTAPFTGIKHITMPSLAENTTSLCLRSTSPTPVTVQSLVSRIEVKA